MRKITVPCLLVLLYLLQGCGCGPDKDSYVTFTDPEAMVVITLPKGFTTELDDSTSKNDADVLYTSPERTILVKVVTDSFEGSGSFAKQRHIMLLNVMRDNPIHENARSKDLGDKRVGNIKGRLGRVQFEENGEPKRFLIFTYSNPITKHIQALLVVVNGDCTEYSDCDDIARDIVDSLRLPEADGN